LPHVSASAEQIAPLILIVEDDPFVAFELEHMLKHEGYHVLGPAPTISAALALLRHADPDAAVLDVNLRGDKVTPVAEALANSGVPFVLASGDAEPFADAVLANARNLGKPTGKTALLRALETLLN
jgi:CheY-like chemotaxis protein